MCVPCFVSVSCLQNASYQSDTEKENLKDSSNGRGADDVAVTDGRHRHHEEVDAFPVAQFVHVVKVGRVAAVLKLKEGGQQTKTKALTKRDRECSAMH